jgi:hypothetical protein
MSCALNYIQFFNLLEVATQSQVELSGAANYKKHVSVLKREQNQTGVVSAFFLKFGFELMLPWFESPWCGAVSGKDPIVFTIMLAILLVDFW